MELYAGGKELVNFALEWGAVPGDAVREVRAALLRYAGVEVAAVVPMDVAGLDGALAQGRTLAEAAPSSPARAALRELAHALVGEPLPSRRRRGRGKP